MKPIRPAKLLNEIEANAKADIPTMIWGSPGLGKSDLAREAAKRMGAKLFELRANLFDPVDVRGGLKIVEQVDSLGVGTGVYRTVYGVPEDYPPSDYQGPVMLFVDELPNASKATQNALLQLLLDKKIGSYSLPPQTVIVAAGNRAADRAAVNEMPTPVKNRFAHYELTENVDDWVGWALRNSVDPTLIGFIRFRPQMLNAPNYKENAFPTPRSWAMLDRKLKDLTSDKESQVIGAASVVGESAAGEFITYRDVETQMPNIDDILANPGTTSVPKEASVIFAVSGALASRADTTTIAAIIKYAERMPPEYQMITVRDSIQKDRTLLTNQDFRKWALTNASVLV